MKITSNSKTRSLVVLFVFFLYLLILTLCPFEFSVHWLNRLIGWGKVGFLKAIFHIDFSDMVQNIFLFIPFGWILFKVQAVFSRSSGTAYLFPFLVGMMISGSIETTQLFLQRSPSLVDLLTNTSGTVFGFFSAKRWGWHLKTAEFLRNLFLPFPVRMAAAGLYAGGLVYLMLLPIEFNRLSNWDVSYPLLIGNEATQDRPWNGEIYSLVLFSQALKHTEISKLYRSVFQLPSSEKMDELNAIASYTFSKQRGDTVLNQSSSDLSLALIGNHVRWNSNGSGARIENGNGFTSKPSSEKIVKSFQRGSQFTVVVCIRTLSLDQRGPARIVSVSANTNERNFTLGQEGSSLVFRVRTPLAGRNGSRISLFQQEGVQDTQIHLISAVFDHGIMKIYRDNQLLKPVIRGDIPYLPMIIHIGRNSAAKIAFCLMFFIPFGVLFGMVFRKHKMIWTIGCSTAVFIGVSLIYFIRFGQPFSWYFFTMVLFFTCFGAGMTKLFDHSV